MSVDWSEDLPMFPLGSVALPGCGLPLRVFEPRYRALVLTCLTEQRPFGSVLIERGSEVGGGDTRAMVGTLMAIVDAKEHNDGTWSIIANGIERIRVREWLDDKPFPRCNAVSFPDGDPDEQSRSLQVQAKSSLVRLTRHQMLVSGQMPELPELSEDPGLASFQLLALSPLGPFDQLRGLCEDGPSARLRSLIASLEEELTLLDALSELDGGEE